MLLFFRVIMCCLYNDYDYENSSSVNEAFSYEIIKYKPKKHKTMYYPLLFALLAFVWAFIVNKGELHTFYKKGTAEEGKSFVALCVTSSWLAYYIVDEKFFTAIIVGCVFAFILDLIMRRKISAKYRY
jgi:hypothetical protein